MKVTRSSKLASGSGPSRSGGIEHLSRTRQLAASCCFVASSSLSCKSRIKTPPKTLAGRAGSVRFKNDLGDLTFSVQYSSPVSGDRKQRGTQIKGNELLATWCQQHLAEHPARTLPVRGGDLNTGLDIGKNGDAWEKGSKGT